MTKKPIINAILAMVYIIIIASVMYYGPKISDHPDDTIFAPIAFISLFTLSAAVMGYLFALEPIKLYIDGEKKRAVNFFLQTVASFAVITTLAILALFFRIFS